MRQRHRLGQLCVQPQRARYGPRDLSHLNRMGQTGAIIIALVFDEHLRLVLQPPKGAGVNDPVAVPLKAGAECAFLFRHAPSPGAGWVRGKGCAHVAGPCGLSFGYLYWFHANMTPLQQRETL